MSLQRIKGRNHRLSMTAALGASLLAGGGLTAHAQMGVAHDNETSAPEAQLKDVNLVSAPLQVALRLVRQQTHIEYVLLPGEYQRIEVSIQQKPVSEALKIIAASAGAEIWQESGVYFLGPKGSAPRPAAPPQVDTPREVVQQGPKVLKYEKFYLKYTPPRRMLRMLGLRDSDPLDSEEQFEVEVNRQFIEGLRPKPYFSGQSSGANINILPNVQGSIPQQIAPNGAPVAPGAPSNSNFNSGRNNPNPAQSGQGAGGAVTNQDGSANADQSAHRDGNDFQNFGRGQGAGGLQPPGVGGAGGNQPTGTGQAAGFLQGISPQDIFALDSDNSLVLRYDDQVQIQNLIEVLRVLDVKPRQVQIKAEFVTVTQNDVSSFGLNFNFTKVNLLAGANIGYQTANTAFIQYATGNLQAQLSFILTQGRGKVVASPLATTLNGVAANFQSTQQIPVLTSGAVLTANGQSAITSQISTVSVAVQLIVVPRINGDESITLTGQVTFSDVTGSITDPSGGTIPITITQPVTINRIVRNGDSMVIAGLTRKRDNVSTNKVPLLGDLPLIGTLFRSRNVTTDDSELVVFITPTIIPERPSAVGGGGGGGNLGGPGGGGGSGLPNVGGGGLMP